MIDVIIRSASQWNVFIYNNGATSDKLPSVNQFPMYYYSII
jgi:hypothetical protein